MDTSRIFLAQDDSGNSNLVYPFSSDSEFVELRSKNGEVWQVKKAELFKNFNLYDKNMTLIFLHE